MRYDIFAGPGFVPLKIDTMGFSSDVAVTKFGPGQRDKYIVHYVTKGKGFYNGNSVCEGQGFLIFPGQSEEYFSAHDDPWEFLWVVSSDTGMSSLFERYDYNKKTQIFDYDTVPVVKNAANEIMSAQNKIWDPLKMLEIYIRVLNSHTYGNSAAEKKKNAEVYIDFCVNYIESNIHDKITVEELSQMLGVSQPYLYKLFIDRFGMSTKEYIIWYKMNRAKKLLNETSMSVTKIANSVGFADVLAFSRAFSKKVNVSPQNFRTKNSCLK